MTTGKKPAKEAGKELASKKSTAGQKAVAASDLSQAKKAPTKKKEISLFALSRMLFGNLDRRFRPAGWWDISKKYVTMPCSPIVPLFLLTICFIVVIRSLSFPVPRPSAHKA
jgi:hypothetical protein